MKRVIAGSLLYQRVTRRFRTFPTHSVEFFINEYSCSHRDVRFLQVGANDGITWDPFHYFIRRDAWHGVVIEPQREVFEHRLSRTYGDAPGIRLLNVAVDVTDGSRPLYRYAFSASRWATGLASFDRAALIANFDSDYIQDNIRREGLTVSRDPDVYLTAEPVPCVSFASLIDSLKLERLDFLITDVEGHDVQIIDTFPLDVLRPANIVFELPPAMTAGLAALVAKLRATGYAVLLAKKDAIAMRRDDA